MLKKTFPVVLSVTLAGCAIGPTPLDNVELASYVADKEARVDAAQEPVSRTIDLYEAMARALKYNLDTHVEVMELALRNRQLDVAHYSMLPKLVAGSGYADRDNYAGGSSVRILSDTSVGAESLTASASSERDVRTADLKFSWHVLDFGLSWIRAKQAADRALIAEEVRRKVVNRVVEDVRSAYWRAVTATRLLSRLGHLEGRVKRALADTQALIARGDSSPLTALTYERELVEIQREIRALNGDLSTAKTQLAALMNVKPGTRFSVAVPNHLPQPRYLGKSAQQMVSTALHNRPELREAAYNERINEREAEAAIVEMLPGVSFDAGPNWNSNTYLFNNHWLGWGAQASWNLIKVFSYPARREEVFAKDALLDARARAVTMAVMTQVHVARARLIHARRKFRSAAHFHRVQWRIIEQIRQALAAGKVSEQTAIREEMNGLVAQIKLDLAYSELQGAFATAYASMGLAPYNEMDLDGWSVDTLRKALRRAWGRLGDRYR